MVQETVTGIAKRNRGISALAAISGDDSEFMFASGGYDGFVFLWTIRSQGAKYYTRRIHKLEQLEQSSSVIALAYRSADNSLLSAAGRKLSTSKHMSTYRYTSTVMSNNVRQIHTSLEDPNLVILEVSFHNDLHSTAAC